MSHFELTIFAFSLLIFISILMSKISFRFGIPSLLLFLIIGMLAGSDGIGKLEFDNPELAQRLGVISLIYILLAGGMETDWKVVKPIAKEGFILSTLGVIFTAFAVSIFCYFVLQMDYLMAFLLGSVVSSTDAASVFNLLRTSGVELKGKLKPILELESGSNDPMAVILTLTAINLIIDSNISYSTIIVKILWQIILGGISGYFLGIIILKFMNSINLEYDGLYTVIIIGAGLFIYSLSNLLGGNGFLAVYLAGMYLGNHYFVHKKSIIRFMDGIGWLMQIIMFLVLGLLVFPKQLVNVFIPGLLFSLFLIFFGRPFGVLLSLLFSKISWKERIFISWVGLRGAAPIILATFPLTAGVQDSNQIFNLVFFTVLISLIVQGSTLKWISSVMGLSKPMEKKFSYPFEFENKETSDTKLEEFLLPMNSPVHGKTIRELQIPEDALITMIVRGDKYIIPTGRTQLESLDLLLVLVNKNNEELVAKRLQGILDD